MISFPFGNKNKGRIGIALYDSGVTIGQCSWKHGSYGNPSVHRLEQHPKELTASDWQNFINPSTVVGAECSISLPTDFAHHQVLRMPNMNMVESKEAAGWEMADRLGVDRSTLQIDAIQIGSGGDVLAIAIEQASLSSLLEPIYEAGFQPTSIEPQCVAIRRTMSMLHRRQSDQSIVRSVLEFGMEDSAFMVLAGDSLMFYKHLPYSGNTLIKAIASRTGVTIEQASGMLEQASGSQCNEKISKAVRDATRATHEAIATDAMKCIRHYGVTNRGPLSTQLVITGSAGWNSHLADVLQISCNQDVVPDVVLPHFSSLPSAILDTDGWHVALGSSLADLSTYQQRRGCDRPSKEAA